MAGGSRELPVAIAHRGGNETFHENTLEAFLDAIHLGYERLETDVHLGAPDPDNDGRREVLAVHGQTETGADGGPFVRIANELRSIANLTTADRRTLPAQEGGFYVPTLDEIFDLSAGTHLNIDAKTPDVVEPLLTVLRRHNATSRVTLASFDQDSTVRLREGAPDSQSALTWTEAYALYDASQRNDLSVVMPPNSRGQVPTSFGGQLLATESLVGFAHQVGVPVDFWTINDEVEMVRLIDSLGVDGIFTDRVSLLKRVLEERGAWPSEGER